MLDSPSTHMPWGLRRIKAQGATLCASGPETAPRRGLWSQWGKVGLGSSFISPVLEGAEGSWEGEGGGRAKRGGEATEAAET